MQVIPLQAVPSQAVMATLAGQLVQVNAYQKAYGLFVDLYLNNVLLLAGVIAQDRTFIVRSTYLGFEGDLFFTDTMGSADPTYEGLGTRYQLTYAEPIELAA